MQINKSRNNIWHPHTKIPPILPKYSNSFLNIYRTRKKKKKKEEKKKKKKKEIKKKEPLSPNKQK